jgi:superfamily II DNA helicase RecQ
MGPRLPPAYRELGALIDALGHPRVLALTATAAPPVRDDIVRELNLRDPIVITRGFDRPNIHLGVRRFVDAGDRDAAVVEAATTLAGCGIVYAATRKRAEALATAIGETRPATHYHGALARADRDESQQRFVGGDVEVIAATNAFGMGIDKPDVRWVLHADLPESLDAYYQEVGRAGRDGDDARAILFYRQEDVGHQRFPRRVRVRRRGTGDARRDPSRDAAHVRGDDRLSAIAGAVLLRRAVRSALRRVRQLRPRTFSSRRRHRRCGVRGRRARRPRGVG